MTRWLRSETEILRRIISNKQTLANAIHFALDSAFPYPEKAFGQDVLIGLNVLRTELGLAPDQKPGDIDLLIVPFNEEKILVDRTIAIEVKIVRPSIKAPDRDSNESGRSQAAGLLADGFPYVGLLHVSIPESLPSEVHWNIPVISTQLTADGKPSETGERFLVDPFPLVCARRQNGRIAAMNLPKEIAFHAIAMSLSKDGERFGGNTVGDERRGLLNSKTSKKLLIQIEELVSQKPERFTGICWFGNHQNK